MSATPETTATTQARLWLDKLQTASNNSNHAGMPLEASLPGSPDEAVAALAACCEEALKRGLRLGIVLSDEDWMPELSQSLALVLRPLCLILPGNEFTARITLRATLSLLRSRLHRPLADNGDDDNTASWQPLWAHTKTALQNDPALRPLWQSALSWSNSEARSAWPTGIEALFPVLITSAAQPTDAAVSYRTQACDVLITIAPGTVPAEIDDGHCPVLLLNPAHMPPTQGQGQGQGGSVVIADRGKQLRYALELVSLEIADLELELATVEAELAQFSQRYHQIVGQHMVTLDELQAELALLIAAATPNDPQAASRAQEAQERARQSQQEEIRYQQAEPDTPAETPMERPDELKKLFRKVAQKVHPDRAISEQERATRTRLMAEANQAYRQGDSATLHRLLHNANRLHESASRTADKSSESDLEQQLAQLQKRLTEIQRQLITLCGSRLYELFLADAMAQKRGRSLLQEMAANLLAQIQPIEIQLQKLRSASIAS